MKSNHAGVYLSQIMTKELMDWSILNKVVAIIADMVVLILN